MITKLLNGEIKTINRASLIIGILTVISALFAILRESLLAAQFGAGDELDIYFAAFKVPDLVFNVIFFGAISAGLVPIFLEEEKRGEPHAWEFVNNLLVAALIAYALLGTLLFVTLPWLMPLIAPGFAEGKLASTISLSRLILAQPLILGISAIFAGVLQARRKFFAYSLAPILYNIGIIGGLFIFVPRFGIFGLGYGVILGALLHALLQWSIVRTSGFRVALFRAHATEAIRRIAGLMTHRSLNLAVNQATLIAVTFTASYVGQGALAVFNLANNLTVFIVSSLGTSLAIASFPSMAALAETDLSKLRALIRRHVINILFFLIPLGWTAVVLREQVIHILLGYGKFDVDDIARTAAAFGIHALGVAALGLTPLLIRAFFSLKDTRSPLLAALVNFAVTLTALAFLYKPLGTLGIALAYTIGNTVNSILLLAGLHKKLGMLITVEFWKPFKKIIYTTLVSLGIIYGSLLSTRAWCMDSCSQQFLLEAIIAGLCGGGAFIALNYQRIFELIQGLTPKKPAPEAYTVSPK